MRLSEVKGERVFDVIADIIDPVASIASSDDFRELMNPKECPEGVSKRDYMLTRLRKTVPSVIRNHKHEAAQVMATLEGVTVEQYLDGLTMVKLLSDVTEMLTDEVTTDFLASLLSETESAVSASD